ncbi:hypothetical protein PG996_006558 [Apiospora saccharicola]|uniref:Uncharacterized protein n=1 Tax=Apiospora saccharicola TaxID=335842 RepID=A0ABR1VAV0_9PEZI
MQKALIADGSSWSSRLLNSRLSSSEVKTRLVSRRAGPEARLMVEAYRKSFARSYPANTGIAAMEDNAMEGENKRRAGPEDLEYTQLAKPSTVHLMMCMVWGFWFSQHKKNTPTTFPSRSTFWSPPAEWNTHERAWMKEVRDWAPFVYPARIVACGHGLLKASDHPIMTEDELRRLQRQAMDKFLTWSNK